MRQPICSTLLALSCLLVAYGESPQDDRNKAAAVWEQALAAKGGRERLAAIRSFAIQERTTFSKQTLPEMAVGKVDQMVCELPDGWWEFIDYRPGKMGYAVRAVNARTGRGWASSGAPARPLLRPDTLTPFRLRQLQYLYFLETSAIEITPLRASRQQYRSKTVDRIEAESAGDGVVVDLDVVTHLPVRIEITRQNPVKPPRPDVVVPPTQTFVHELDEYREVAGIQVPGRITRQSDTALTRVEINPAYNPSIFTTPPSPDSTVDSWRKRE